jgi:hypothetical protein
MKPDTHFPPSFGEWRAQRLRNRCVRIPTSSAFQLRMSLNRFSLFHINHILRKIATVWKIVPGTLARRASGFPIPIGDRSPPRQREFVVIYYVFSAWGWTLG